MAHEILGRLGANFWQNDYSGPFILWAVESDPLLEDSDEDASDDILG
jgi:hypothetical protein